MRHTGYIDYMNDMKAVNNLPKELVQIVDRTVSRNDSKTYSDPPEKRGDSKDSVHKKKCTYPINKQDFLIATSIKNTGRNDTSASFNLLS